MQLDNFIITLKSGQLLGKLDGNPSMNIFSYEPTVLEKIEDKKFFIAHQITVAVGTSQNKKVADIILALQCNVVADESEVNKENTFLLLKNIYFNNINSLLVDLQLPILSYQNYNILCNNIQFLKNK